ncbi:unnamed protein product, partial [Mesorhabditis spiculigera]
MSSKLHQMPDEAHFTPQSLPVNFEDNYEQEIKRRLHKKRKSHKKHRRHHHHRPHHRQREGLGEAPDNKQHIVENGPLSQIITEENGQTVLTHRFDYEKAKKKDDGIDDMKVERVERLNLPDYVQETKIMHKKNISPSTLAILQKLRASGALLSPAAGWPPRQMPFDRRGAPPVFGAPIRSAIPIGTSQGSQLAYMYPQKRMLLLLGVLYISYLSEAASTLRDGGDDGDLIAVQPSFMEFEDPIARRLGLLMQQETSTSAAKTTSQATISLAPRPSPTPRRKKIRHAIAFRTYWQPKMSQPRPTTPEPMPEYPLPVKDMLVPRASTSTSRPSSTAEKPILVVENWQQPETTPAVSSPTATTDIPIRMTTRQFARIRTLVPIVQTYEDGQRFDVKMLPSSLGQFVPLAPLVGDENSRKNAVPVLKTVLRPQLIRGRLGLADRVEYVPYRYVALASRARAENARSPLQYRLP